MTRLAYVTLPMAIFFSGCSGPIETRVQTASSDQSSKLTSYRFSTIEAPNPDVANLVEKHSREELEGKGYNENKQAPLLLSFSIADRPASIAIKLGEEEKSHLVTDSKEHKIFQSCKDREHRLIVTLTQQDTGDQFYRGTASEYHCKAKLRQTIPHLVKAAFSDLGGKTGSLENQKVLVRRGLE